MPDKACTRCKRTLPESSFRVDARLRSGLASACKGCEAMKSRAYRAANPGKHRVAVKRWQDAHPEQCRAHKRAQYDRNPERYKANTKAYQAAHPEQTLENKRRYDHSEKGLAKARLKEGKRRAQKRQGSVEEKIPAWVVKALFRLFDNLCAWCRRAPAEQIDHVQPLARGGAHAVTNFAPACAKCNTAKGAMLPEEFAVKSGCDLAEILDTVKQGLGPKLS